MTTGATRDSGRNRAEPLAAQATPTSLRGPARSPSRRMGFISRPPSQVCRVAGGQSGLVLCALLCLAFCTLAAAAPTAPELGQALSVCLPVPDDGWSAEGVVVDETKTNLEARQISASRQYKQTQGGGEVDIRIERSRWCCWLINFSGDLKKMTVKGRKAGVDEQRDESTVYVRVKKQLVVSVQAENMPQSAKVAERFATGIDYDKLEALVYR